MNKFIYSNIKITKLSVENIFNRYKEIELEKKKFVSSKKSNKNLQTIIKLSDEIVNTNKFQLNLLNKNQFNLSLSKSKDLKIKNFNILLLKTIKKKILQ